MDDLKIDEMSKEQRQELKDFESSAEKIMTEIEEERKVLELEFKKLLSEVAEIQSTFDEKVKILVSDRYIMKKTIAIHELHMLHLAKMVFNNEDALKEGKDLCG